MSVVRIPIRMPSQRLAIFTICSNNYVPIAKVLVDSVRRVHPEAAVYLCLADRRVDEADFYPPACKVVTAEELDIPDFPSFAFRYDVMELNTAVKPYMFRYLFDQGHDPVLYFDPDIEVFAPLDGVLTPLREGASLVLTPHLCQPAEGDANPDDIQIMRAGVYNLGFLGASARPETDDIMRWWSRRLLHQCISAQSEGIFVDQKFMDLVPGFSDSVKVLRDPAYNVAYWNLTQRRLTQSGDDWLVDGQELRFFHFSGIDPTDLSRLSKYTTLWRGDQISPTLGALMRRYADQVISNGFGKLPRALYAYGRFASGVPIPEAVRHMFRERHAVWGGDPFEEYEEYLKLPTAHQWAGSSTSIVTNLMAHFHQREPSLHARFDLGRREDVEGYTDWFIRHGHALVEEPRLVEPVAERAGGRILYGTAARRVPPKRAAEEPDVSVIGYLRLALGIGEAGRQTLRTLAHAGFDASGLAVDLNSNSARVDHSLEHLLRGDAPGRFQIFNINADQLPHVIPHLAGSIRPDAYRIIVPFWELSSLPDEWLGAFDLVDEVWAPTRFVQTTLLRKVSKPVFRMPLLLDFKVPQPVPRKAFGLPEGRFLFFFAFDFFSFVERKNPLAVVRAFKQAFGDGNGNDRVGLVLKTLNGHIVTRESAALRAELRDTPNITFVEGVLQREETLQLIDCCDAIVSLHRSEGLGLLVAEAMALGKPVISTDYSATTELVTARTGFPVDYRLVPVQDRHYPFHEGQVWAEPDVAHAAWLMRHVVKNQADAERHVAEAKRLIKNEYGINACGARARARLHQLERQ